MPNLLAVISCDTPGVGREALVETAAKAARPLTEARGRHWVTLLDSDQGVVGVSRPNDARLDHVSQHCEWGLSVFVEGYLTVRFGERAPAEAAATVARGYREEGEEVVRHIDGSFLIVIVDEDDRKVLVCTDRAGTIPAYYARVDHALIVAPELKCFAELDAVDRSIAAGSLASMFLNGSLIEEHTYWQGVKTLPPAHRMCVADGRIDATRYWSQTFPKEPTHPPPTFEDFGATLCEAVRRHVSRFERPVLGLSGGLDSRVLLGAMRTAGLGFSAVTWGFDRLDMPGSDYQTGIEVAKRLGISHETRPIDINPLPDHVERVAWLTDGLTGHLGNFPEGTALAREIAETGDALVVGNHAFGRCGGARSLEDALHGAAGINRMKRRGLLRFLLRRDRCQEVIQGYDQQLDLLLSRRPELSYPDLGDTLTLDTWMSAYIMSQARVHRQEISYVSPFLDVEVFDRVSGLSAPHRDKKRYLAEAGPKLFPEEFAVPLNRKHSRGDWQRRLREPGKLQRCIVETLLDPEPGFDAWFDRASIRAWLADGMPEGRSAAWPATTSLVDRLALRLTALRHRRDFKYRVVFNLLTLKLWFGLFGR